MGLLMIVGGLVVQRSRAIGGILVAAAVVIALCLIYKHPDFRTTNVWVWSAPIVLAVLAAVFAGLALKAEIEPVGRPSSPRRSRRRSRSWASHSSWERRPRSDPGSGADRAGRGPHAAPAPPASHRGRAGRRERAAAPFAAPVCSTSRPHAVRSVSAFSPRAGS